MAISQAMGFAKGRGAGAAYSQKFIEDVKASGIVASTIEKAGVKGVSIAPAAPVSA